MDGFSERLRAAMASANIKAIELSEKTGINRSSISEYLAGSYEPKQVNIFKMAKALGVKPSYLMGVSVDSITSNECKAGASTKITIESGTQGYDLMQAYLRHPQRVREEIVRRANSIDTTFAQNVSRLLDASGDLNGFKQETNLSNVIIGKLMAGQPVLITPEEAERVADYFDADIVEMFFGEVESTRTKAPPTRTALNGAEGILLDELARIPENTYTHRFYLTLLEYIKNEQSPSYDKTQNAINLINGFDFEKWLTKTLNGVEKKQPHRFSEKEMLDVLAKRLYNSPGIFVATYTQSAFSVKNLIIELIKESNERIEQ